MMVQLLGRKDEGSKGGGRGRARERDEKVRTGAQEYGVRRSFSGGGGAGPYALRERSIRRTFLSGYLFEYYRHSIATIRRLIPKHLKTTLWMF